MVVDERRRKAELALTLGFWRWIAAIAGALILGVLATSIGETRNGYEWLIDSIAAVVGAIEASEFILAWQAYGPMFDGLAIVPALVGGLVAGIVAEVATRLVTHGTYALSASAPRARHTAASRLQVDRGRGGTGRKDVEASVTAPARAIARPDLR